MRLYYKISEDLKIYPEHNGYTHDKYCCRYKDITGTGAQKLPYIVGENGDVTVCTSFDPGRYPGSADNLEQKRRYAVDSNAESTESEEILIDRDNSGKRINEPQLGLDRLIRCINVDCFTEKVLNNKTIENRLNFSTYVYHRTKRIRLSRNKRVIGDLNLEKDGVRFIYTPFAGINQIKDQNFSRCYIQTLGIDEKIFKNFTFPEIAERAMMKFRKQYGTEPDANTFLSGFQYIKNNAVSGKNKSNSNAYRVLGRVHLFQVSDAGIYCRSMTELNTFNALYRITSSNHAIKFWIPPEDESVGAIIEIDGCRKKILLLFRSGNSNALSYNPDLYVPFVVDNSVPVTEQILYTLVR